MKKQKQFSVCRSDAKDAAVSSGDERREKEGWMERKGRERSSERARKSLRGGRDNEMRPSIKAGSIFRKSRLPKKSFPSCNSFLGICLSAPCQCALAL